MPSRVVPLRRSALALIAASLFALLLGACASTPADRQPQRAPTEVRAEIVRRMPTSVPDRAGWAADIQSAFALQGIDPSTRNLCAVIAVTAQESGFVVDPVVPNLPRIARAEIDRRAASMHVPSFLVTAALKLDAPDGRSYAERLAMVRTEKDLSAMFEAFIGSVPLGKQLFGRLNPVHTAGPMQVSIAFAKAHAHDYPYPVPGDIRDEVFTRRGGLFFGIAHLLGYETDDDAPLYRFADFNAGWYASRNAAFQAAVTAATGIELALDGDLLAPGAPMDCPGSTERAVRTLRGSIGMDDDAIRRALAKAGGADFSRSELYQRVFAAADAAAKRRLPRAVLPGITLQSPKITRKLTTAWFANRVNERWQRCVRQ